MTGFLCVLLVSDMIATCNVVSRAEILGSSVEPFNWFKCEQNHSFGTIWIVQIYMGKILVDSSLPSLSFRFFMMLGVGHTLSARLLMQ